MRIEPKIVDVHISSIKQGDTVLHNGKMRTVSGNNIKRSQSMGKTIFGDSYLLGYKKVKKIIL